MKDLKNFISSAACRALNPQQVNRYKAVLTFMNLQHSKKRSEMEHTTRKSIALIASRAYDRGGYVARQLPRWEKDWIESRTIRTGLQGCGRNLRSLFNDEDLMLEVRSWLSANKGKVTTTGLRLVVGDFLGSKKAANEVSGIIDEAMVAGDTENQQTKPPMRVRTARRWLHRLGLSYKVVNQVIFKDGHEREDVKKYRQEVFVPQFLTFLSKSVQFEEDGTMTVPEGIAKPYMFVTHDESWFNSNDGRTKMWLAKDDAPLRKKGRGKGLMVSDFLTPSSRLKAPSLTEAGKMDYAAQTLEAGSGCWWNTEKLLEQVKEAEVIFGRAFPNFTGVWLFDNATSHASFAIDALSANAVALRPGGKQPKMRDGYWGPNRQRQSMVFPPDHPQYPDQPKGARAILEERGLWRPNLHLDCKTKNAVCEGETCCARRILANQEDFRSQKSAIQEYLEAKGHAVLFIPKFHCELNWIERFWGACKRYTREHCEYSVPGLRKNVQGALNNVPDAMIQRFFRRSVKIIKAYHEGLDFETDEYKHRVYSSHRRLEDPANW